MMADRASSDTAKNGRAGILSSRVPKWYTAAARTSPPNVWFESTTADSPSQSARMRPTKSPERSRIHRTDPLY